MNDGLKEAITDYQKNVLCEENPAGRQARYDKWKQGVWSASRVGHVRIDNTVDWYKLYETIVPNRAIRDGVQSESMTQMEEAVTAMASTMFPQIFANMVTVGMLQTCPQADYNLPNVFGTTTAGCGTMDFYGFRDVYDIVDDCEPELAELKFYGLCPPLKISQTRRCKKRFAHALSREMLCVNGIELIQQMINNGSVKLRRHRTYVLAEAFAQLYPYGENRFPFVQDDMPWKIFYSGGNGAPWINATVGNKLDGTWRPFDLLERFIDEAVDPYTGEPVTCTYPDLMVMDGNAYNKAVMGQRSFEVEFPLPEGGAALPWGGVYQDPTDEIYGNGTTLRQTKVTGLPFGNIYTDRYLRQSMKRWYEEVLFLSAADAAAAAHQTWFAGNFRNSLVWATEWPEERLVRQGPNTWEYFNQEIIYMVKYLEKADPMWVAPWGVIANFPDLEQFSSVTNMVTAYHASTGTVAQIPGLTNAATANVFWQYY